MALIGVGGLSIPSNLWKMCLSPSDFLPPVKGKKNQK